MASGLERGSRSANRLNQADMSLDPPGGTAHTHTHGLSFKSTKIEVQIVNTLEKELTIRR